MRGAFPLALLAALAACDKSDATAAATSASAAASVAPPASAAASVADPSKPSATASAAASASAAPEKPPEWITAQHVLVAYKGAKNAPKGVTRAKADAKKRAEEVRDKARAGEDFSKLVEAYSDDGTKERQGSVGKITRDKVVKEFADAAFALKVDQTSDVVESPFGFHVIKRNQ